MTLIEVLAGLALLAALLMSVLTARTRSARQWSRANERLRAVRAADRLLSDWWQDAGGFPRAGDGAVPGAAGLKWRSRVIPNGHAEALGMQLVRLQVGRLDGDAPDPAVVAVEVLLPLEGDVGRSTSPGVADYRGGAGGRRERGKDQSRSPAPGRSQGAPVSASRREGPGL